MATPPRPTPSQRRAATLTWSVRLRGPTAALALLLGVAAALWAAMPALASALHARLPVGTLRQPTYALALAVPVGGAPPPPVGPAAAATPGPTRSMGPPPARLAPARADAATAPPTPPVPSTTNLPCHIQRNGGAVPGKSEWALDVVLDENATDQAGRVVIPVGTVVSGLVRVGHDGEPVGWPGPWRLRLPEDNGAARELEITAAYQAVLGGIGNGATGRLSVSAIGHIGERRVDANAATANDPDRPPVSILTDRAVSNDDLPR